MSTRKVQKTALILVVSVVLYTAVAFVIDATLIFLLGIEGWPVQVVNVAVAIVCGYKVSRWNDRQDELERERSEVES